MSSELAHSVPGCTEREPNTHNCQEKCEPEASLSAGYKYLIRFPKCRITPEAMLREETGFRFMVSVLM